MTDETDQPTHSTQSTTSDSFLGCVTEGGMYVIAVLCAFTSAVIIPFYLAYLVLRAIF